MQCFGYSEYIFCDHITPRPVAKFMPESDAYMGLTEHPEYQPEYDTIQYDR